MSIKNLQEISSLVTNYTKKNRFVEVIEEEEGESKYLQLIRGLGDNSWNSEDEAIHGIYDKPLGNKTFAMLKTRAKERLVNMIFQLDTQKRFKSSYDKAYFSTCKNLLAGSILLVQNRRNSGEELLELALTSARKHYFTDLSILALRQLRYFSSYSGSRKSYKKYDDELKKSLLIQQSELYAEELNQELILEIVKSFSNHEELIDKAKKSYRILQSKVREFDTYTLRINMYRVGIRYYDFLNDFRNVIKVANECEAYLYSNPHILQKIRLGEMNLQKLSSSLHLRDYKNGSVYAQTCMTLFNPGTVNWLIFLEYYFLLCLHTKNYEKAGEIYHQVISHSGFINYSPQSKEKWKIFESFLIYALPDADKMSRKFNIPKFLNEVPLYSKDKAGYNLSIIIAQTLLSLKIGDYSKIVERAEALKLYANRYIKKEKNPRSYYFIKMLLVMIQYDFEAKKTAQIAGKFYEKLKSSQLGMQSELESLEVIPYDLLWPEILKKLNA